MEKTTMKALVYHSPDNISLDELPIPELINPDDVLGRVTCSAICTSDVHIMHGHIPSVKYETILGHEFCIEAVEANPEATDVKGNPIVVGKHYCVLPASTCGECEPCKQNRLSACINGGSFGIRQHGGQADYLRIPTPSSCLVAIPDGMKDRQFVLLGDMLATAWFGIVNADVKAGDKVAVVGLGPVGMCACELLTKHFGCTVVGYTRSQEKIDLALEHGVIVAGVSPKTEDVEARTAELTDGKGFSAVIETPGNQGSIDLACSLLGVNATLSTIAIFATPITFPMNKLCYKNVRIRMGVQYLQGIDEMFDSIVSGKIDTTWMVTHSSDIDGIIEGYEVFGGGNNPECIKWVIEA